MNDIYVKVMKLRVHRSFGKRLETMAKERGMTFDELVSDLVVVGLARLDYDPPEEPYIVRKALDPAMS